MNRPTTILIAESDVNTAVPLLLRLQDHGFRTLHASNGGWALKLARATEPDLILLAVGLPPTGGLIVCRALRLESAVPRSSFAWECFVAQEPRALRFICTAA